MKINCLHNTFFQSEIDETTCKICINSQQLNSKLYNLQKQINLLTKQISTNYITISGLEFLYLSDNFNNSCKSKINFLFFENNLPQMWILNCLEYGTKHSTKKIAFVFLISNSVSNYVKHILKIFLAKHYVLMSIK